MSVISGDDLTIFSTQFINPKPHSDSVRSSSIDLKIGKIFHPQEQNIVERYLRRLLKENSIQEKKKISLKQGQTAVIQTIEKLDMPNSVGGLVFPSNRMSMQGLLVTNSGHIDPNYSGYIHVTVINMSRQEIILTEGEKILRAIFFLSKPFADKLATPIAGKGIDLDLLEKLSPDFLDVTSRATQTAREEVRISELRSKWFVPILTALIAAISSIGYTYIQKEKELAEIRNEIKQLKTSLEKVGSTNKIATIEMPSPSKKDESSKAQ